MNDYQEEFEAAAKWWADTLRRDEQRHNNGEAMGSAMLSMADDTKRGDGYDPELVDAFESELPRSIREHANEYGHDDLTRRPFTVGVDYNPDGTLSDAAERAGIENVGMATFPSKTTMWIRDGLVTVREGYRADIETVYGDEVDYYLQFVDASEGIKREMREYIEDGRSGHFVSVLCALGTKRKSFSERVFGSDGEDPIDETFRSDMELWSDESRKNPPCREYEFFESGGEWYLAATVDRSVLDSLAKMRQIEAIEIEGSGQLPRGNKK